MKPYNFLQVSYIPPTWPARLLLWPFPKFTLLHTVGTVIVHFKLVLVLGRLYHYSTAVFRVDQNSAEYKSRLSQIILEQGVNRNANA